MGTIFRRVERRPIPKAATVVEKDGQRFARWRTRGKLRTVLIEVESDGSEVVAVQSAIYVAKYRDHTGRVVARSTGCREETTARHKLAQWEAETEQILAGILDATALETARASVGSLAEHLGAYEQSLIANEVSDTYRANARRGVQRLIDELDLKTLSDFRRDKIEPWLSKAISDEMSARTRNYYRDAGARFLNWCMDNGRVLGHDLNKLPKADERADPKRKRRAFTEAELIRLLAVALTRPLKEARTIRRGKNKGLLEAELSPEAVAHFEAVGRERVLIYRTLVLTGLRLDELRTLTVAQVDLTPGAEVVQLEAKNEKNGIGSEIPLRSDLADELRSWIDSKKLAPSAILLNVPTGFLRIFDRDLKAAGIPKRDERKRTVDLHALRTTFATMLSTTGTAPRTAQAAMRHANLQLTMGTYTDAKHLDVREAMSRLPNLNGETRNETATTNSKPATKPLPTGDKTGHFMTSSDNRATGSTDAGRSGGSKKTPRKVNENAPVTTSVITGAQSGWPELNRRLLAPKASALPS